LPSSLRCAITNETAEKSYFYVLSKKEKHPDDTGEVPTTLSKSLKIFFAIICFLAALVFGAFFCFAVFRILTVPSFFEHNRADVLFIIYGMTFASAAIAVGLASLGLRLVRKRTMKSGMIDDDLLSEG
jgi:hypothetical protein